MKKILLSLLFIFGVSSQIYSESTGSGTARNVLIDGEVVTGAAQGVNGGDWEEDEVFEGFMGIVNWYLSWDDDNLYIGKIGGNNAEPALIYIRSDYTGSEYTNTPQSYDGFTPNMANLSGVNFVAFMKDTYDEFRTFNGGAWSGADLSLNPQFGNFGAAHLEVAIPWNQITNGNGKPENVRVMMFQLAPDACNPGEPFVYGESPWGTGEVNDGPSIGVNDGTSTSARQPGGCGVATADITRWWGCYPAIAGVSSNGFVAVQPNAGNNLELCDTDTELLLNANDPSAEAVGTWSVISKPSGASDPTFDNANDSTTTVRGLTAIGVYELGWSINYGGCPSDPDTLMITRYESPSVSNAGSDMELDCELDSVDLAASMPTVGNGSWKLISGSATIDDASAANTRVRNLGYGAHVFEWSVGNGPCDSTRSQLTVTRYKLPTSAAGNDQQLCDANSTALAGNDPLAIQATASGEWSQLTGPSTITFTNSSVFNTNITGLSVGVFELEWTVSNGTCTAVKDTVEVEVFAQPTALAGTDQDLCEVSSTTLAATDPGGLTGTWTQLNGPTNAVFTDATLFNTDVSGLSVGDYEFQWAVSNGVCAPTLDTVMVHVVAAPSVFAGDDMILCEDTVAQLNATTASPFQAGWVQVSGPTVVNFSDSTLFNTEIQDLVVGQYEFAWIVDNGVCPAVADSVIIDNLIFATALAGDDQELCEATSTQLAGNDPNGLFGSWLQLSGPSTVTFDDINMFNATVSGLTVGTYELEWSVQNFCGKAIDRMFITVSSNTDIALVGADQVLCNANVSVLTGNTPTTGIGSWSVLAGSGLFDDASDGGTTVRNLGIGANRFIWTINNGVCGSTSDTLEVLNLANPGVSATVSDATCLDLSNGELLINIANPNDNYSYSINAQPLQNTNVFSGLSSGEYDILVRGDLGCEYRLNDVSVGTQFIIDAEIASQIKADADEANGSFTVSDPTGGNSPYEYSIDGVTFGNSQAFSGLAAGNYTLTIRDDSGCTFSLLVTLEEKAGARIYNAFSPNGDAVNDTWNLPFLVDYPNAKVQVFNIWGKELFSSSGTYTAWDGTFNGEEVAAGTYYYIIDLKNGTDLFKGSLTIIR